MLLQKSIYWKIGITKRRYILVKQIFEGPILFLRSYNIFEGPITKSELLNTLKSMANNKSPGNDGLTKEFLDTFWEEIKIPLCNSITKSYQNGEPSISQRHFISKV